MPRNRRCWTHRDRLTTVGHETDLGEIWREVQAALPAGWLLDSLRCAGTGLAVDQRSDEWIAVAVAPDGSELRYQAPSPAAALRGLPLRALG